MGLRLGLGPKGLLKLNGRSLISLAAAGLSAVTRELVVAVPAGWTEKFSHECPGARIIEGADTRQETVRRLLAVTDASHVIIHDAARPFLPAVTARRVLDAAREHGAATAVLPVADSLLDRSSGGTPDRSALFLVQTPQAFRHDLLSAAHERAHATGTEATDDAALVRLLGEPVATVEGSPWLFKITAPGDLELARAAAAGWP